MLIQAVYHVSEDSTCRDLVLIVKAKQLFSRVELAYRSLVHNDNLLAVSDSSLQLVSNHKHRCLVLPAFVNKSIKHSLLRFFINLRSWLIHEKNAALLHLEAYQRLTKRKQLDLTIAEERALGVKVNLVRRLLVVNQTRLHKRFF